MAALTCTFAILDNASVIEESSEAEYGLSSDEQSESDQQQCTDVEESAPDLFHKSRYVTSQLLSLKLVTSADNRRSAGALRR